MTDPTIDARWSSRIANGRSLRAFLRPTGVGGSRRDLLRATGLVALGGGSAALLGACSGGGETGGAEPSGSAGPVTIAKSDVPEGGGLIEGDFVITQPSAGEYKAFSSVCTHEGCPVSSVEAEEIVCNCHGSKFSIADGSVTGGPAEASLPAATIEDSTDELTVS